MQRRDVSCQQLAVNHSDAQRPIYYYCYHCQARTLNGPSGPRSGGLELPEASAMMTGTYT
ncbi:hypothetical protein INR49_003224 [Caranx melampygus]|nr:hypothetical protein INR49_003224 [Caranx melampygus]